MTEAEQEAKRIFLQYWNLGQGVQLAKQCAIIDVKGKIEITHTDPYDRKKNRSVFDKQLWEEVLSIIENM